MRKVFASRAVTVGSASLVGALLLAYGGYLATSTHQPTNLLQVPKTIGSAPVAKVAPSTTLVTSTTYLATSSTTPVKVSPTTTSSSIVTTTQAPTTSTTVAPTITVAPTTTTAVAYDCLSPASAGSNAPVVTTVNPSFANGGATVQVLGSNLSPTSEVLLCPTSSEQIAAITVPESAVTGAATQINVNVATLPTPAVTYDVRIVSNGQISPLNSSIYIAVPGITTTSLGA